MSGSPQSRSNTPRSGLIGTLVGLPARLIDTPMGSLQRLIGVDGMPYVFLTPNFLFFGLFVFLPIVINIVFSVTGGTALFPAERPYVGSDQYAELFNCRSYLAPETCHQDHFWRAIYNTLIFVGLQVTVMVLFSLVTALVLNMKIRARAFFRAVYFFPVLLSPVVVALIWKWILQRDGLLNAALTGLGGQKILFLIDPTWAMTWSIFISVWAHMGFYALILLAGLQAIPADLYEAAEMDATPTWRVLFRITLPLLWPNMVVVIVLALIRGVQTFDEVFAFTGGGPGTATMMIVQYIYETAFAGQVQNFGLAAAASVVLGVVLFALTILQLAASRRKES
jgi:alpha-1,4-digalacturonate transport system permease protein